MRKITLFFLMLIMGVGQKMLASSSVGVSSETYDEGNMTDLTKSSGSFDFSWDD